jgi:hypothetical protein
LLSSRAIDLLAFAAAERLDISVLKASIAIAVVFATLVIVVHWGGALVRKFFPQRRGVRQSPEPPAWPARERRWDEVAEPGRSTTDPPDERIQARPSAAGPSRDDPEQLQRACAVLAEELAQMYLELAECWLRKGQLPQARNGFETVIQRCPDTHAARQAQERLRQMT